MSSLRFWRNRKVEDTEAKDGSSRTGGSASPTEAGGEDDCDVDYEYGIKVLHDCNEAILDIVFVHGLTGNRLTTWTYKSNNKSGKTNKPWPKILLKDDIPNARILTFGYDANVVNFFSAASQNRVREHASSLNATLSDLRDETETNNRPIIMVAHSLGGILCKEALLTSKNSPETYLRNIYQCTRAIAFLGTPHSGSTHADWGVVLGYGANLVKKTNKEIIRILKPDSEVLARIQQDFYNSLVVQIAPDKKSLKITCFFEELPMSGLGEIVPKHSAIIPGFQSRGIHANHMDMTKFRGRNDPGYKAVLGELRRWIREIEQKSASVPDPVATVQEVRSDSWINSLPQEFSSKGKALIYTQNNSGGGMIIQGNNINNASGSVYFGK